jgi:hypothetical protein
MVRGVATWISLNVCYPDGRLKIAGWGGMWISDTEALIFSELDMSDVQKKLFRGRRRLLRKPAWGNRPTLIRQTVTKPDEPICSVGEFQSSNGSQNCALSDHDRGAVQKVTFKVSVGGRYYEAVINEDSMPDTAVLILSERAMNPDERNSFNQQPAAIAVRRLRTSTPGSPKAFELVCYGSAAGSADTVTNATRSCGRGKLPVSMPA